MSLLKDSAYPAFRRRPLGTSTDFADRRRDTIGVGDDMVYGLSLISRGAHILESTHTRAWTCAGKYGGCVSLHHVLTDRIHAIIRTMPIQDTIKEHLQNQKHPLPNPALDHLRCELQ